MKYIKQDYKNRAIKSNIKTKPRKALNKITRTEQQIQNTKQIKNKNEIMQKHMKYCEINENTRDQFQHQDLVKVLKDIY